MCVRELGERRRVCAAAAGLRAAEAAGGGGERCRRGVPSLSSSVSVRLLVVDENDNAPLVLHPSAQDSSPPSSELVPAGAEAGTW